MQLKAAPVFVIVKISRTSQKESRSTDRGLAISSNYVFMQHEIQNGEIVSIGSRAKLEFPTAKVGDSLLFHHFITGKGLEDKEDNPYLVCSDDEFNYYRVTTSYYNGDRNLSYGIYDGEKIIPHNDFVFLKVETVVKEVVKVGEIFEIQGWTESRDKKTARMADMKAHIGEMSKSHVSQEVNQLIEKKEKEMNNVSKQINKKEIVIHTIEYAPEHIKYTKAGILNIACHTHIDFMNKEYIVAPVKYLYFGN